MLVQPIGFRAQPEKKTFADRYEQAFYVQEINPDDSKMTKLTKKIHNNTSLVKYDGLEGKELKEAQLHNFIASMGNPLTLSVSLSDDLKLMNRQLNEQKAKETYDKIKE